MVLIVRLRGGNGCCFGGIAPGAVVELNGQTCRSVMTENLLDDHFRLDRVLQIDVMGKHNSRIDVVMRGPTVPMVLPLLAPDAERLARIPSLVKPAIFPKDVTGSRLGVERRV